MGHLADRQEREDFWKTLVPAVACPFKAELEGNQGEAHVLLTNVSSWPVTVTKIPSQVEQRSSRGGTSSGFWEKKDGFITLKPGGSARFE